jgi:hypothetical protein
MQRFRDKWILEDIDLPKFLDAIPVFDSGEVAYTSGASIDLATGISIGSESDLSKYELVVLSKNAGGWFQDIVEASASDHKYLANISGILHVQFASVVANISYRALVFKRGISQSTAPADLIYQSAVPDYANRITAPNPVTANGFVEWVVAATADGIAQLSINGVVVSEQSIAAGYEYSTPLIPVKAGDHLGWSFTGTAGNQFLWFYPATITRQVDPSMQVDGAYVPSSDYGASYSVIASIASYTATDPVEYVSINPYAPAYILMNGHASGSELTYLPNQLYTGPFQLSKDDVITLSSGTIFDIKKIPAKWTHIKYAAAAEVQEDGEEVVGHEYAVQIWDKTAGAYVNKTHNGKQVYRQRLTGNYTLDQTLTLFGQGTYYSGGTILHPVTGLIGKPKGIITFSNDVQVPIGQPYIEGGSDKGLAGGYVAYNASIIGITCTSPLSGLTASYDVTVEYTKD